MRRAQVSAGSFRGPDGGGEHYLAVQRPAGRNFRERLASLEAAYAAETARLGLGGGSQVFLKFFLGDIAGQAKAVRAGALCRAAGRAGAAVSLVEQPPLPGGDLALLAYHISGRTLRRRRLPGGHTLVETGGQPQLWSTGLRGAGLSPGRQTAALFGALSKTLKGLRSTLAGNCVRTWLYLADVERDYAGMVAARRAYFAAHGLTHKTHYIASTGIQGWCGGGAVGADALSLPGLRREQVSYLNDLRRLCPADAYSVTFERGARIAYADRAHLLLSGTASIDRRGRVVHPGDVRRQLDVTLRNVSALLRAGGAGPGDLTHLVVYLRDAADFEAVDARLRDLFPRTPYIVVRAPVCRPAWLVEIEGAAAVARRAPRLPSF